MVSVDAMFAVIAGNARRADNGDEEAALQLNRIAEGCSAEWMMEATKVLRPVPVHPLAAKEQSLGEVLAEAMGWTPGAALADEFSVIDAAAQVIGDHYSADWLACLTALFDLERELVEAGEHLRSQGVVLTIATIGDRVARKVLGFDGDSHHVQFQFHNGDLDRAVADASRGDRAALAEVYSHNPSLGMAIMNPKPSKERLTPNPVVLYRSVSLPELADILHRGCVIGAGNTFNPADRRPYVFFGDTLSARLMRQGEYADRQVHFSLREHPMQLRVDDLAAKISLTADVILAEMRRDGIAYDAAYEDALRLGWERRRFRDAAFGHGTELEKYRQFFREIGALCLERRRCTKLLDAIFNQACADRARWLADLPATSAIIVTRAIGGAIQYPADSGDSGHGEHPEYGLIPGQVRLSDIARICLVKAGLEVESWAPCDFSRLDNKLRTLLSAQPGRGETVKETLEDFRSAGREALIERHPELSGAKPNAPANDPWGEFEDAPRHSENRR